MDEQYVKQWLKDRGIKCHLFPRKPIVPAIPQVKKKKSVRPKNRVLLSKLYEEYTRIFPGMKTAMRDFNRETYVAAFGELGKHTIVINDIANKGYAPEWSKVRAAKLKKSPRCENNSCRTNRKLTVHHINHDKSDNREENLQTLCWKCHAEHHDHMQSEPPKHFGDW